MSKLTDEQIQTIFKDLLGYFMAPTVDDKRFARAIEAAATAPLMERIAELERQLEEARKQMEAQKNEWLSWEAKRKALEKDAERYRWIRKQHWSENLLGVVVRPKDQTKLGSMLPSMELLDDTIDHMSSEGAAMQKGQS